MHTEENEGLVKKLFLDMGEDPEREGLLKTPERHLKAMEYLTSGYKTDVDSVMNKAVFKVDCQDMVVVRNIEFYSLCEHHLLPFYGRCHVGYIPNGRVIGLSKVPRLIEVFARRLQVQERLTGQVSSALAEYLQPAGVGVVMEAYHLCMMMRGIEKQNSFTVTSSMLGDFRELATRNEFMSIVRAPSP